MLSKHLFVILSSSLVFVSTRSMEMEEKENFQVVVETTPKSHEILGNYACSLLKINDRKAEDAIKALLKSQPNESPERKQERMSLLKKLSDSLDAK